MEFLGKCSHVPERTAPSLSYCHRNTLHTFSRRLRNLRIVEAGREAPEFFSEEQGGHLRSARLSRNGLENAVMRRYGQRLKMRRREKTMRKITAARAAASDRYASHVT
ncbi:hypothetical protein DNTS_001805 [Danionella cerebrum]|uniref:Uncharacterized protein n=1 Tax=Danionella cerebrum TaxID=2873325 RepID=A0A553MNU0_9TELE|nr:hypothetical protein DNTS_001805 [Danionella translucida]